MVNFPSLLVSEEENPDAFPGESGESTVHSWINADFVPSWLRPFTLDQNTRFTRTPDHLLRPPEEPQPIPSFGIGGASWHFLETPVDPEEERVPVPGVKADLEALENALADLPALRAAREGTRQGEWQEEWQGEWQGALGAESRDGTGAFALSEPQGWSVDENGIETRVTFESEPFEPQAADVSSGADWGTDTGFASEAFSPSAGPVEASPVAAPVGLEPEGPFGPMDASRAIVDDWADVPASGEWPPAPLSCNGPGGAEMAAEAGDVMWSVAPQEPVIGTEAEMVGPAPEAPAWDAPLLAMPEPSMSGPAMSEPTMSEPSLPALSEMSVGVSDLPLSDGTGAVMGWSEVVSPTLHPDEAFAMEPPPVEMEQASVLSDDVAPVAYAEPMGGILNVDPVQDLPEAVFVTDGEGGAPAPVAASPTESEPVAVDAVAGDAASDAAEAWGNTDLCVTPPLDSLGAAGLEVAADVLQPVDPAADDEAMPAGEAQAADAARERIEAQGDVEGMTIVEEDLVGHGTLMSDGAGLASFAVEPLDDALLRRATEALEAVAALPEAPVAMTLDDERAPAHLVPLTRLIVVGRLALPAVGEQDLAPVAAEAEPEPVADEPVITAHFSWQPYQQSIRAHVLGTPVEPEPATMDALVPGPVADAPVPALPAPQLPVPVVSEAPAGRYELPAIDLLREPPEVEPDFEMSEEFLDQSSSMLQQILRDFGIRGEVIDANPGPVVTLYEFEPARGVKSSRVIGLAPDIARSMSAVSARVAVVEGRNVIGIELPNRRRETVWLRELLDSHEFAEARTKLGICLGKTIGGEPVIADLARMPHLLVAGTTGSGKSVAINTMILSLLYRHTPDACRLIMIDPKMLELSIYEGIPHLLTPVVTDPKKAIIALKWAVKEMEDRYHKMARLAVRNIDGYNARMAEAREKGEVITRQVQVGFDKESGEVLYEEQEMDLSALPYIVIIVDEMADLMMVAGKEIEGAIQRLAQMARAAGIHLVMATQRPSVDVITGTIKANFPTRISFQVTSKIDSRTILGEMGAETLLGQGDMLFMAGGGRITRVHGPFVSDQEVEHVVAFLKAQGGPDYLDEVVLDEEAEGAAGADEAVFDKGELGEGSGDLYDQAVALVLRDRKASTSYIQRRLQVGYNKAASLMERMENEGIVGPANHAGKREILSFSRPE